jgi:cell division protein FtsB
VKFLNIAFLIVFLLLQVRLWFGEVSVMKMLALKKEVLEQQDNIKGLKERNQVLEAEVLDLKTQLGALEEHARIELGMIRQGETLFQEPPDVEQQ